MTKPDFSKLTKDNIVDFIGDIFLRRGADSYLGEDVTMSEHMLQGAQLAEQAGANEEAIASALLHDIGHYTNEFPEDALEKGVNNYHDEAGAFVLKRFFPQSVTDCVQQHVAAKRYLCAVDPEYLNLLSDASVHTLKLQGGPMDRHEVDAFEEQPHLDTIIQVRKWDDEGKVAGVKTPDYDHYAPLLQRIVDRHAGTID
ncbi:MAG: HD domain-containing protein [Sneathiella sp.]|nr:HD domain-containing protein [Sneathiella sp.]